MRSSEQEQQDKRKEAIRLALSIAYIHDLPSSVRHHRELIDTATTVVDEMLHIQTYGSFEKGAEAVSGEYKEDIAAKFTTRFTEEKAKEEAAAREEKRTVHFDPVTTRTSIIRELVPEITERLTAVRISTHGYEQYHARLAEACGRYVRDQIALRRSNNRPIERPQIKPEFKGRL